MSETRWFSVFLVMLIVCAGCARVVAPPDASAKIKHIVIVVQENRSFDNLFYEYPGADSATSGLTHDHKRIPLRPTSFFIDYDISHGYHDFLRDYDGGKMDGFDLERAGSQPGATGAPPKQRYPQYAYLPRSQIEPYWEMAQRYVLADRMFQSNLDQSFAAHLYLIAGQAGHSANVPSGRPWGCDAWPRTRVHTIRSDRQPGKRVFPCFSFKTLADELDGKQIAWRYYAPALDTPRTWRRFLRARREGEIGPGLKRPDFGQLWSAYDAIVHIRYGPDWSTNVVSPETSVLGDIAHGDLPAVSWVVPDMKNSDHAISRSDSGPDWVGSIVNAIGASRYWNDAAVVVVWDDSGGWYDHVPPPQLDYDGLGDRVPMLVISPYAKRGFVSHTQYEFGSILKFTEHVFGLAPLAQSDRRAHDLTDCFDFEQLPRAFVPIATRRRVADFIRETPSRQAPDDD